MLTTSLIRATRTTTSTTTTLGFRAFSHSARAPMALMSISGRLGAAPEEVQTSSERSLVRYTVASGYGKAAERKTSWFRVAAFVEGGQKELLLGLAAGTLVHVDADARMESYTDKEGAQRTSLNLVQKSIDILSRPRSESRMEDNDEGLVQEAHA